MFDYVSSWYMCPKILWTTLHNYDTLNLWIESFLFLCLCSFLCSVLSQLLFFMTKVRLLALAPHLSVNLLPKNHFLYHSQRKSPQEDRARSMSLPVVQTSQLLLANKSRWDFPTELQ